MRIIAPALALAAALCASAAPARSLGERIADLPAEQKLAIGVRVVDVGATVYCLDRRTCREEGPMRAIFGPRPKPAEVIGFGVGTILLSSALVSIVQDRDPAAACRIARINLVVSGTAAGITLAVAI